MKSVKSWVSSKKEKYQFVRTKIVYSTIVKLSQGLNSLRFNDSKILDLLPRFAYRLITATAFHVELFVNHYDNHLDTEFFVQI